MSFIDLWNAHAALPEEPITDSVDMEEGDILKVREPDMKKKAKVTAPPKPAMGIQVALPPNQFNNVIRWIKNAEHDRLVQLEKVFNTARLRLGFRKFLASRAVAGIPPGSDHFDSGSLIAWLGKVSKANKEAAAQVAMIHATLRLRLG